MNNTPQVKAPWLKSKDPEVPAALTYSELSMCSRVEEMVRRYPDYIAYEFMGKCTTYAEMWKKINACAKSLKAIGIREGDKVTICMPNAPQTLCMFYAVNMVGAIANMVHPLSAESEIAFYLRDSGSVAAITLDQFYNKFESVRKAVDLPCLIITSVADELKPLMKVGYKLTEGRKNPKVPSGRAGVLSWKEFLRRGEYVEIYQVSRTVKRLTRQILFVYALAAPFKVLNMILGGGILRSGGRTAYVMGIDMLGTWGFGVPLGLLGAFVWRLPIASVYLLLSLEECIRFAISMAVFRRKRWMRRLG